MKRARSLPPAIATAKRRQASGGGAGARATRRVSFGEDGECDTPIVRQSAARPSPATDADDVDTGAHPAAVAALPNPGRQARVAPALHVVSASASVSAAARPRAGAGGFVVPSPPPAPLVRRPPRPARPPCVLPECLPPGTDYTELLLTTWDADLLRRELGWMIDEVELRHPRFDSRMLAVLRSVAAAQPPDFLLWRFIIISYAFSLPDARQRLASATPWHRLEPILHHWEDEFFVFSNARHTYYEAANDQLGKPRAYVDWVQYTLRMRFAYLCHYDQAGQWTATIPPRLPQPLKPVGVAADPRAYARAPVASVAPRA